MKNNISQNKLYWVYLVGFFLILALPLLNLPPWFSPPDWGKTIAFRIILSILLFIFIFQKLINKDNKPRIDADKTDLHGYKLPFYLLLGLLGIYLLATLFSQDIYFSLWGSPYRSGGFVNFAFYVVFAILVFFILKEKDWQKIWWFSIFIGILVSLIAIFQQFGLLKEFFITFESRPPSTIGGPIFLAIYLLLLSFLTLSFGIREKKIFKKLFYFASFLFFVFVAIFITQTRAVMVGLGIGFLYFLFFYPFRKKRFSIGLKFATLVILLLGIYGIYFINTQPQLPKFCQEKRLCWEIAERFSIKTALLDPRISGWKVSFRALKDKPILGYGPENFNIGFDKYYDSSLPQLTREFGSWWDRAHNFIFDIAVTAGLPALIIYLALFGILFWQLQRLKSAEKNADSNADKTLIVAHGIQATFIGYLVANFFSFDTFSTYLISFLLIGYSLHLISLSTNQKQTAEETLNNTLNRAESSALNQRRYQRRFGGNFLKIIYQTIIKWRKLTISILFILLIWFIWQYNIKPFQINTQINIAKYLAGEKKCEQAFTRMEKYVFPQKSFLDHYARAKYFDFMLECETYYPDKTTDYAKRGFELSKENVKIRPFYVRSWLFLSGFNTVLIAVEQEDMQKKTELVKQGEDYLKKAEALSPKRQEVFIEWSKYAFVSDRYELLKEKAQRCVDVNPKLAECYWYLGLAEIVLGNFDKGKEDIKFSAEKGYSGESPISLGQLEKAHSIAKNYEELVIIYQKLIALKPEEPQYHATLAFVYKEMGDYKKAREEAMKVLELQPEAREMVDEFLRTLR